MFFGLCPRDESLTASATKVGGGCVEVEILVDLDNTGDLSLSIELVCTLPEA